MKKTLRRLPVLLAVVCMLFAASCSDIDVEPVVGGEDDDGTIVIPPKPPKPTSQNSVPLDSVSLG